MGRQGRGSVCWVQIAHHQYERWVPPDAAAYSNGKIAFDSLRTDSAAMARAIEAAKTAACSPWNVLIHGETGVGKELIAQSIHNANPDTRDGPFVPVNLANIPPTLVESTLFGHVKGAFSGADATTEGVFAKARGGTILLDEIGDFPLPLQPTLLQVLSSRKFRVVGGDLVSLKARVLFATHRDLRRLSRQPDLFREDLFYRVAQVVLEVPAVRERAEDIVPCFLGLYDAACAKVGRAPEPLTDEIVALLIAHDWPGNFRELQNLAIAAATKGLLEAMRESGISSTRDAGNPAVRGDGLLAEGITNVIIAYLVRLYDRFDGDVAQVAVVAKRCPATIDRLLALARQRGWPPKVRA